MEAGTRAIRAALERILASDTFALSERHRNFLRYIVEETLAGRGDRLKGYTIGVEALGRDPEFDARNDPYVRVEAGRLRKRLIEYYDSEGVHEPIRIELKRGRYAVEFVHEPTASRAPESAAGVGAILKRRGLWIAIPVALALIAAVYVAQRLRVQGPTDAVTDAGLPPSLRVQAFEDVSESEFQFFADGLTQEILIKLDRFRGGWGPITIFHDTDLSELDIRDQHDYRLSGTVSRVDNAIHVTARLIQGASGEQLWTDSFDESFELSGLLEIQDTIATRIANVIREPVGPIASAEIANIVGRPPDSLSAYECMTLYLHAIDTLTLGSRADARACLERLDEGRALSERGLGALSVLNALDYRDGVDFVRREAPAIDRAYDAAQRALDIEGNSVIAQFAMALVNIERERLTQARNSAERILALNPPPSTLGISAFLLISMDESETAMEMFSVASTEAFRTTPLIFLTPSLYYLEIGDFDQALTFAQRIDAPEFLMAQTLWAALTAQVGELDRAHGYAENILRLNPAFPDHGREIIGRWALPERAAVHLIEGLALAGIDLT